MWLLAVEINTVMIMKYVLMDIVLIPAHWWHVLGDLDAIKAIVYLINLHLHHLHNFVINICHVLVTTDV